jgi:hypothetical protein
VELTVAATTEDVAELLRTAFGSGPAASRRQLAALYGEEVALSHEPALPVDGPVDGARLGASSEREAAAIGGAIADQRYEEVAVRVDGDRVHVSAQLRGSLPDGRPVDLPLRMRCAIAGGRIVAVHHQMDGGAMRAWAEVALAGGMEGAAALVERDEG